MKKAIKNKKGIASFYVVAFSTLILLVIAVSFASLVVSQMERSSNADLSQSAYDAAMAGVEDAKLAYMNYRNCKKNPSVDQSQCSSIIEAMEGEPNCNMVSVMLGRSDVSSEEGVMIREGNGDDNSNNMQQYYTCVKIYENPTEYTESVSPYQPTVFKPEFENEEGAGSITEIKISWGDEELRVGDLPKLSVSIVQAPVSFNLESFTYPYPRDSEEASLRTNMGTVFLEPCESECDGGTIGYDRVVKSNDKTASKNPFKAICGQGVCTATIRLLGENETEYRDGEWNSEAFEVVVTSFDSNNAVPVTIENLNKKSEAVPISNQFVVDSTGRASNLFKRVRVTLDVEGADESAIAGPLILGDGGLLKNFSVSTEHSNWGDGGE